MSSPYDDATEEERQQWTSENKQDWMEESMYEQWCREIEVRMTETAKDVSKHGPD